MESFTTYENFSLHLNSSQQTNLNLIKEKFSPYTSKIYIVGGYLRDTFLNIPTDDIDIEIIGINKELFRNLLESIGSELISEKFNVYRYNGLEISLARVEKKVSSGYHGFEIELAKNEKEATQRRDFTMNALMYNICNNKLYDYHNGLEDIKIKRLKAVNIEHFSEDSLRLVRAVRFMAQLGFKPDNRLRTVLKNMDLQELSKSRINKELQKLFV